MTCLSSSFFHSYSYFQCTIPSTYCVGDSDGWLWPCGSYLGGGGGDKQPGYGRITGKLNTPTYTVSGERGRIPAARIWSYYREGYRVGNSIICFSIESIICCDRKIDSITVDLFKERRELIDAIDLRGGAIGSFGMKREKTFKKHPKNLFFRSNRSFCDRKNDAILKMIELMVDLITDNLFQRSTRSIWSRSIFLKIEKIERSKIKIATLIMWFVSGVRARIPAARIWSLLQSSMWRKV